MATKAERAQQRDREQIRNSISDGVDWVLSHPIVELSRSALVEYHRLDWGSWATEGDLKNQYARSLVSAPSNFAEGVGKGSLLSLLQSLKVSRGSAYEALIAGDFSPQSVVRENNSQNWSKQSTEKLSQC